METGGCHALSRDSEFYGAGVSTCSAHLCSTMWPWAIQSAGSNKDGGREDSLWEAETSGQDNISPVN